jgi:hypothetical protein
MDKIRERTINFINKYNFNIYNETIEQFINRRTEYNYLLLNTPLSFIDIVTKVRDKYNYMKTIEQPEIDTIQTSFKIIMLNKNTPLEDIKKRYSDNFEEVEERMFFRFELYKEGWNIEQIERYICKYLTKTPYKELNLEYYEHIYYNMMIWLEIYKKDKIKKIGRPSLPSSLKRYIRSKNVEKTRDEMRKKYEYSNKYENIKDNLLSLEELNKLEKEVTDKDILNKLKYFTIGIN